MFAFRSTRRCLVVRVLVLVLFAHPFAGISAEACADSLAPQALRDALQNAWKNHPLHAVSEAQQAAVGARRDAANRPLYNPELELAVDNEGEDRTATAGVRLTLDLSGKRRARSQAADANVAESRAEAGQRRRDFIRDWFAAWTDLRTASDRIAIGERRLALVSRFAELADKQFAADDISGLERDLAVLAQDEALVQQSQLEAERSNAEAELKALGGSAAAAASLALATDSLPPSVVSPGDPQQHPEWQVAHARSQARVRDVDVARRNRVADPSLGIRGGRIDYGSFRDTVFGVSLSIPLFVRNSHGAEVIAAQAEVAAADAEIAQVRLRIDAERQRATRNYAASRAAWSRWQSSRGTDVEHRAQLLERLWREGEVSTADTLLQLKQTLDTALAGAELEARVWRDYADTLAAAGQLERWFGLENTR